MEDLKSWGQLETGHDSTLASVVSCARAVVCRLPLTNGAKPSRYCKLILGQLGGFTMLWWNLLTRFLFSRPCLDMYFIKRRPTWVQLLDLEQMLVFSWNCGSVLSEVLIRIVFACMCHKAECACVLLTFAL
jgi:hypothetical protein